jgi:hypothetical protein
LLLSDDFSNRPGDEANQIEMNYPENPVNVAVMTDAIIPIPNDQSLPFWSAVTDHFVAENNNTLSFMIGGAPIALRQPSVRRGHGASMVGQTGHGPRHPMYNPSQPKLFQFCALLVGLLTPILIPLPIFLQALPLARLIFHLCWPDINFVNSRRDRGLREKAPKTYVMGKVDLYNLVKFTL